MTYKVVTDLKYYVDRFGIIYYTYKGVKYTTNCVKYTANCVKYILSPPQQYPETQSLYDLDFDVEEIDTIE